MNRIISFSTLLLLVSLLVSCAQKNIDYLATDTTGVLPMELPATFSGRIPCPDCDYVQIDLNLRPDNLYQLRKTSYIGDKVVSQEAQMRRWHYDEKEHIIILGKRKGSLKTYSVKDKNTLSFLDIEGQPQQDLLQYDLIRTLDYDPFDDVVKIRGMYSSTGNVHMLKECSSEIDFPVDPSGTFTELDRTYRNTPHEKGEPLLVSFQGRLLPTRNGKEKRDKDIVVVSSFTRLYPDQDCNGNKLRNSIFGVYWTAVEIFGKTVPAADDAKAPFFVLDPKGDKVKGYAGCNRFSGTFLFKGEVFIFNKLAATRMACPHNLSVEDRFFEALDKTESYRIEDGMLLLMDKNEEITMRLKKKE